MPLYPGLVVSGLPFALCGIPPLCIVNVEIRTNWKKGLFLYISDRHTWDEKTFMQIKAEANDLHENLPLVFENIKKFPQMWSKSLVIDP